MSMLDIVLTVLIGAALVAAVVVMIRSKRKGNSCCGGCGMCSSKDGCPHCHDLQKK